jgi:enoyl-CoA hydratase/carnithine racemase
MDSKPDKQKSCNETTVEKHGNIAIMRFTRQPLFATTNLRERARILNCLQQLIADAGVKVIIIFGAPDKSGPSEYGDFLDAAAAADDKYIYKMLTMFNQLILNIVHCPKAVMYVDSGAVLSQFLHMSLACDYRLVSEDTIFHKAYLDQAMVPKGGGAWFLRRMLGVTRAFDLLTNSRPMSAQEALDMGLIHEIAPANSLQTWALERAHDLALIPTSSLAGIKSLLHFPVSELETYLEHENMELFRAFTRMRTTRQRAGENSRPG